MLQRVFVRVVGFSGAERHALNTVFRLSQESQSARQWCYEPWIADVCPAAPRLALIDGASPDASEALADIDAQGGIGVIWVGSISPAKAWGAFQRPIIWPDLLGYMDDYFTPRGDELDGDFGNHTRPSTLESKDAHMFADNDQRRALLADADNDSRLYLRTKFSSFGIHNVDEAANVLEARDFLSQERSQGRGYDIVIIDLDLPGGDPWGVLALASSPRLKLLTQHRISFATRMSAKVNGYIAMGKPLDPSRLNELLAKFI